MSHLHDRHFMLQWQHTTNCIMSFAIIGDVHSQADCLESALNYCIDHHLQPLLLGDLFDSKCPFSDSVKVYQLVKHVVSHYSAIVLHSNHQDKLIRYLQGNDVVLNNGLDRTVEDFRSSDIDLNELKDFLMACPYGIVFRDSNGIEYRAAHSFFSRQIEVEDYDDYCLFFECHIPRRIRNTMIYGPTTRQGRILWWQSESDRNFVRVSGHYHTVHIDSKSIVLDGECGDDKDTAFLPVYDIEKKILKKFYK